jgi:hypothetical protein
VTFTATDEQGNVQQTHPVKADANVQTVHHEMMPTAAEKASSNAALQVTRRSPVLVGAAPRPQWNRTYGGATTSGLAKYSRPTTAGTLSAGYVICGYSDSWTSHSNYDTYLIKTDKDGNIMYPGTKQMSTDTNAPLEVITPATQLTALYAEYDGLLDALEEVQRKLISTSRLNPLTRKKLRRRRDNLCETLADVHEKMADFDFVLM